MKVEIYVITLDRESQRFRTFVSENSHIKFNIFDAIKGSDILPEQRLSDGYVTMEAMKSGFVTDGRLGCALSHFRLWELSARENRTILIAEDDVLMHKEILHFINNSDLTSKDIIAFGLNTDSVMDVISPEGIRQATIFEAKYPTTVEIKQFLAVTDISNVRFYRCFRRFGNCCYLVTPRGAEKLIEKFFPLRLEGTPVILVSENMPGVGTDRRLNALHPELDSYVTVPFLAYTPNNDSSTN